MRYSSGGDMARVAKLEGVGLRYGLGPEVLSDINLSLSRGGFYLLTGPSGAGKTSLLKLLYLAAQTTRGTLEILGEDTAQLTRPRLAALRRRIGVVYQDFRLIEHLSARDNVALPLRIAGRDERSVAADVAELLGWVGLSRQADARAITLSGGEQQRVALARAVIARPELLVADEPTASLDPDLADRLLQLLAALNERGTTVLVATHDVRLATRLPNVTTMRLERGRLLDPTGALRFPPQPVAARL